MGTVRAPTIIDSEDPTFCWKCPKISVDIVGSLTDQDKRIKQLRVGARPVSSSCAKVVQKQERPDIELCTTRIKNIDAISEALDWPPRCIARWLGRELGAMVTCTVKEEGSCCTLTGAHKRSVCQAALDRFVDEYIYCGNCGLPGVATVVPQPGLMCGLCGTCGWAGQLENKHQLAKFLMYEFEKNPSQLDDEENGVIVVRTLLDEILGYETKGALGTGSMQWGALFGDNKMKTEKKDKKEKKEKNIEDKDEKKEKKEKKDEKKEKKEKKDGKENKENKEKEKKGETDKEKKKKGEKEKQHRGERDAHVIR